MPLETLMGVSPIINPPTMQCCDVLNASGFAAGIVGGRVGAFKTCVGTVGSVTFVGIDGSCSAPVFDDATPSSPVASVRSTTGAICQ